MEEDVLPVGYSPAYFAGIMDGEGNICLGRTKATKGGPRFSLQVTIVIREGWLLKELSDRFGGSLRPGKRRKAEHAITWRWRTSADKAAVFLNSVYPYLRLKQKQAFLGLFFQKQKTNGGARSAELAISQREQAELMGFLNRRGVDKWKPVSSE